MAAACAGVPKNRREGLHSMARDTMLKVERGLGGPRQARQEWPSPVNDVRRARMVRGERNMQVRGRTLVGAVALMGVVGMIWALLPSEQAEATSARVAELQELCESPVGTLRRQVALAELVEIDSSVAREALEEMAESKDERLAILAVGALCRAGYDSSIEDVLEDSDRPAMVRSAAMGAYVQRAKESRKTWSQIRGYLTREAGEDLDLQSTAGALRNRFDANGR